MTQKEYYTIEIPTSIWHGLGNRFAFYDLRTTQISSNVSYEKFIASLILHNDLNFAADQIVLIQHPRSIGAGHPNIFVKFFNRDGTQSLACGNATRCLAEYLYSENTDITKHSIDTGILTTMLTERIEDASDILSHKGGIVKVKMLNPEIQSLNILDSKERRFIQNKLRSNPDVSFLNCVDVGNKHIVFMTSCDRNIFLTDACPYKLLMQSLWRRMGTEYNIGLMNYDTTTHQQLRVWERGCGETLACGTGAYAAAVSIMNNGFEGDTITFDTLGGKKYGGNIEISFTRLEGQEEYFMIGPAICVSNKKALIFTGLENGLYESWS